MYQCEHCDKEFKSPRGLDTHVGIKHKNVAIQVSPTDEKVLEELVAMNTDNEEYEGGMAYFNGRRAVKTVQSIRSVLAGYGVNNDATQQVMAVESGFHMERLRATAEAEYTRQMGAWGKSVDSRVLAAQRLAEDSQQEGDVFAAVVAPIELGMNGQVWVTGSDPVAVKEINGLLSAWNVMDTITAAWQDMETYSAFYVYYEWDDGVPTPIHLSPKRVWVGPDTGFGPIGFTFLGDALQKNIELAEAPTGKRWNEWAQSFVGKPLDQRKMSWIHFLKPKHKMYPYPWLARAATPVYTRQVIEEMRLALVQGLINQLWVMTIENPLPGEVSKLKSVIASNRAERVGFLLWRAGLSVENYTPESVESLLLPDSWWAATLDIFRRMGRPVRIISGESPQRGGQGGSDAEIDTRIAQNKAMSHRDVVAKRIVLDIVRQWAERTNSPAMKKMLAEGGIKAHMTPIELFLGDALKEVWGPMWDRGMASVRTIHTALGLDTDTEEELLKGERDSGYEEIFQARQQFAQRVATPTGEVTKSPEPGRPEGQQVTAAIKDTQDTLLKTFDSIDDADEDEDRRVRVQAFIIMLTALIKAQMREAYGKGYSDTFGNRGVDSAGIARVFDWEQAYIDGFRDDLLAKIDAGRNVAGERYRVVQHVQATWRQAYMDGVFQAKAEDGWTRWQRVLRPYASKTGPCEICKADSKVWHPITEPFWDHPYGVCSAQVVRFMRTGTDGWESFDRQAVPVPLMEWSEG